MENTNKLLEKVTGISISDYAYDLPDEKIAKYPLEERDQSKLLVWRDGEISYEKFQDLSAFLPSGIFTFEQLTNFQQHESYLRPASFPEGNRSKNRDFLPRSG